MITTPTPAEVLKRWVRQDDRPAVDDVFFNTLIEDAGTLLDATFSNLQERVDAGTLDPKLVVIVISQMVQRAFYDEISPRSSFSYTSGPFSESGSYGSDKEEKQGLYLTEAELALLRPKDLGKFGTINLVSNRGGRARGYLAGRWGQW